MIPTQTAASSQQGQASLGLCPRVCSRSMGAAKARKAETMSTLPRVPA